MRVAILSDIHGNLTAFEAVLADLRETAPDLVLHGGDLADGGSRPAEVIDRIRALGWQGVIGNGDQMLSRPESLEDFVRRSSAPAALWRAVREMAAFTRAALGEERLSWLGELPLVVSQAELGIVHASPDSCWEAPGANATDAGLEQVYGPLGRTVVVVGHTHFPAIRRMKGKVKVLVNSGSVGLPFDGDPRASYVLLDDGSPQIRRVDYSIEQEIAALATSGLPHAQWVVRMLQFAAPQMP